MPLVAEHCTRRPVKPEARATMGARMEVARAAILFIACWVGKESVSCAGMASRQRDGTDIIADSCIYHSQYNIVFYFIIWLGGTGPREHSQTVSLAACEAPGYEKISPGLLIGPSRDNNQPMASCGECGFFSKCLNAQIYDNVKTQEFVFTLYVLLV